MEGEDIAVVGESDGSRILYRGKLMLGPDWVCCHDHLLPMQAERCAKRQAAIAADHDLAMSVRAS